MRTFTPGQFAVYLKTIYDRVFVYDSRNQQRDARNVMVSQRFNKAQVFLFPPTLALKNNHGFLCFSPVKRIIVDDSEPSIGYIITVECETTSGNNEKYTLIADRTNLMSESSVDTHSSTETYTDVTTTS